MAIIELTDKELDILQNAIVTYQLYGVKIESFDEIMTLMDKLAEGWSHDHVTYTAECCWIQKPSHICSYKRHDQYGFRCPYEFLDQCPIHRKKEVERDSIKRKHEDIFWI